MDVVSVLAYLLLFVLVVVIAIFIVKQTLPPSVQSLALAIVGCIALIVLLLGVAGHGQLPRLLH